MGEYYNFVLKAAVIQGIFFLLYLLFKNTGRHAANRVFLISSLIFSVIIPVLKIPNYTKVSIVMEESFHEVSELSLTYIEPKVTNPEYEAKTEFHLSLIYWTIVIMLLIKSLTYFGGILFLKKKSEHTLIGNSKVYLTKLKEPFSFFSLVFIPYHFINAKTLEYILAHEKIHTLKFHSIDRLLMDVMIALFWFNPIIYLIRKKLIETHEFQADESVVNETKESINYQESLLAQLFGMTHPLVSHFNHSLIKRRIIMLNKNRKQSLLTYFLAVPVTVIVFMAFTPSPNLRLQSSINVFSEPLLSKHTEHTDQDNFTPSILPLIGLTEVKVTSHFGKRKDPFDGHLKTHTGIDFRAALNTKVVSTADGLVKKVTLSDKGYGNLLVIDHGGKYLTRYGQLSKIMAKDGDKVKQGEVVALSGNSGRSTGPHLHYEVIKVGVGNVDPIEYVKDYSLE